MFAFCSRSSATNRSFGRGLRVVEDAAQLGEVRRAQEVRDVVHRLGGERGQRLRLDLQERAAGRASTTSTPSVVTRRYSVASGPSGSRTRMRTRACLAGYPRADRVATATERGADRGAVGLTGRWSRRRDRGPTDSRSPPERRCRLSRSNVPTSPRRRPTLDAVPHRRSDRRRARTPAPTQTVAERFDRPHPQTGPPAMSTARSLCAGGPHDRDLRVHRDDPLAGIGPVQHAAADASMHHSRPVCRCRAGRRRRRPDPVAGLASEAVDVPRSNRSAATAACRSPDRSRRSCSSTVCRASTRSTTPRSRRPRRPGRRRSSRTCAAPGRSGGSRGRCRPSAARAGPARGPGSAAPDRRTAPSTGADLGQPVVEPDQRAVRALISWTTASGRRRSRPRLQRAVVSAQVRIKILF